MHISVQACTLRIALAQSCTLPGGWKSDSCSFLPMQVCWGSLIPSATAGWWWTLQMLLNPTRTFKLTHTQRVHPSSPWSFTRHNTRVGPAQLHLECAHGRHTPGNAHGCQPSHGSDGYLQANNILTVSAEPLLEVTLGCVALTARQSALCALQQIFKPPQQGSQHERLHQAAQGLSNDGMQTLEKARLLMASSHRLMVDVRVGTAADE